MYSKQLSVLKATYGKKSFDSKIWKTVVVKICKKTGEVESSLGGDVICDSIPPDMQLNDGDCIYYILHFSDIVDLNEFLNKVIFSV